MRTTQCFTISFALTLLFIGIANTVYSTEIGSATVWSPLRYYPEKSVYASSARLPNNVRTTVLSREQKFCDIGRRIVAREWDGIKRRYFSSLNAEGVLVIRVYRSQAEYRKGGANMGNTLGEAHFDGKVSTLFLFVEGNDSDNTFTHELGHCAINAIPGLRQSLPLFWNEGLAEYYSMHPMRAYNRTPGAEPLLYSQHVRAFLSDPNALNGAPSLSEWIGASGGRLWGSADNGNARARHRYGLATVFVSAIEKRWPGGMANLLKRYADGAPPTSTEMDQITSWFGSEYARLRALVRR